MPFDKASKLYGLYGLPEYIKASELCPVLGISRSTLFNSARRGLFPAPVRIGARAYRWLKQDLLAYFGESHACEASHE